MNAILFNFKSKFAHISIVSYFRVPVIFYVFYDYRKLMILFFTKFVKLDPDPHSEKLLDPYPDPHKINANPQPCCKYSSNPLCY